MLLDRTGIMFAMPKSKFSLHPLRAVRSGRAGLWVALALALTQPVDLAAQNPADPAPAPAPAVVKPYVITLDGMVNEVMQDRLERQATQAISEGATIIVLEMDTWGGAVGPALEMCDVVKNLSVPTIAWVNPKAISAGAMISVACNQIVASERGRIGDCAPIRGDGQDLAATEREKIETVIREEFRDSARRNGYSLTLSTAMVTLGPAVYQIRHQDTGRVRYIFETDLAAWGLDQPDVDQMPAAIAPKEPLEIDQPQPQVPDEIRRMLQPGAVPEDQPEDDAEQPAVAPAAPAQEPGELPFDVGRWTIERRVLAENQLLTMSQDEAIDLGFVRQIVRDDTELAAYLKADGRDLRRLEANWSEKMVGWLTSPFVQGILTIVLLMALYSEMQSPGLGLPGAIALGAAVLLMGAPYLAGLAEAWEIIIVFVGFILLAVEIFVLPGFGIAGISGLCLIFMGMVLTFVPNEPGPGFLPSLPGTWDAIGQGMMTILISGVISIFGMSLLARHFGKIPILNRIILTAQQTALATPGGSTSAGVGGAGGDVDVHPGDTGTTLSELRPIGRAQIKDQTHDVVSTAGWIAAGTAIRVVAVRGSRIEVQES